jgi:hypothetical protein
MEKIDFIQNNKLEVEIVIPGINLFPQKNFIMNYSDICLLSKQMLFSDSICLGKFHAI